MSFLFLIYTHKKTEDKKIQITVQGKDRAFLLFMITYTIETQKLPIERFLINTQKDFIEDVFYVLIPEKNLEIDILKIRLIVNMHFIYVLQQAPNPTKAISRFQEVLKTLEQSTDKDFLETLISDSTLPEKFAKILGVSDYLWEDFIHTHFKRGGGFFFKNTHRLYSNRLRKRAHYTARTRRNL